MQTRGRPEKHPIKHSISLAIASGLLLLCSCGEPKLAESEEALPEKQKPTIPARRVIADQTGRDITVDIIGRDERTITVVRIPDERRFTIPIERLSTSDLEFVAQLPLTAAPPPPPRRIDTRTENKPPVELIDPEIKILNHRIDDIDEERDELEDELRALDSGTIKFRSLKSKFDDLGRKKQEYQKRIDQLQN